MKREFRKTSRTGKTVVWYAWIDPEDPTTYHTESGQLDGKLTPSGDTPGPKGNPEHSNYQTAEKYCAVVLERLITKKVEKGYVEYVDGEPVGEVVRDKIDFSKPLPSYVAFYKPVKEMKPDHVDEYIESGFLETDGIWTRKRDGENLKVVKSRGKWQLYTAKNREVGEKFPHIIERLEELDVSNRSIFGAELTVVGEDGHDQVKATASLCRSDPLLALWKQGLIDECPRKKYEDAGGSIRPASLYVYDILYWDGKPWVKEVSAGDRITKLYEVFGNPPDPEARLIKAHLAPCQIDFDADLTNDCSRAKDLGWEGYVLYDENAVYGEKGVSFTGKNYRPEGCWKRKPKFDGEFLVTGVYEGAGKNRGKLGGFYITQVHPTTGETIDCGKCGGGLNDEVRDQPLDEWEGKVVKLEYDSRSPYKDGRSALRFPQFQSVSTRNPEDCIADDLED